MKYFFKILIIIAIIFLKGAFVLSSENEYSMDRIDYSSDLEEQITVDEELFTKDMYSSKDYDEYVVYTFEENEDENNENAIVLDKNNISYHSPVTIKTRIVKSYTVYRVEAFNTFWDDSKNFRTILYTTPSILDTVPSIIQESHYRFNINEYSRIDWGHAALSSHNGMTIGFIDKMENSYDSGLKFTSKFGNINFSSAIYESLETHNPSGGILFSTDELKFKSHKGSLILGGGVYATDYINDNPKNAGGIFSKYNYGRFSIGMQIAQNSYSDRKNKYGTACYLYPSFKINDSLTLIAGLAGFFDENYAREEIGIVYKPVLNNPNEFSISLKATFYNGEGITNKQRIKLKTEFKL